MKTKSTLVVAVLVALTFALGYGLGYRQAHQPPRRLSAVSGLRQVGLSFRQYQNDMTLPVTTGAVAKPLTTPGR